MPRRFRHGYRPGDCREGQHDDAVRIRYGGRHDQCNASAAPTTRLNATPDKSWSAVDGCERGRTVLAMVVADQRRA